MADLLQYINREAPPAGRSNNQADMLKDFLAVYAATQQDARSGQLGYVKSGGADANANKNILSIILGDGQQATGLIDPNSILLGGAFNAQGASFGTRLTAESLGAIMGRPATDRRVQEMVQPLNDAFSKFDINTAKKVLAFLINARFESFRQCAIARPAVPPAPRRPARAPCAA